MATSSPASNVSSTPSVADVRARLLASFKAEKKDIEVNDLKANIVRLATWLIPELLAGNSVSLEQIVQRSVAEKLENGAGWTSSRISKMFNRGWGSNNGIGFGKVKIVLPTRDNVMLCVEQLDAVQLAAVIKEVGMTDAEFFDAIEAMP